MAHLSPHPTPRLFRDGPVDAWLLAATAVHTLAVLCALALSRHRGGWAHLPAALTLALGLWWNANTVAHLHLHRPLFRPPWANRALSLWLSVLLGFPQVLWRHRHLWHHAGEPPSWPRLRWGPQGVVELAAVLAALALLAWWAPRTWLCVWLPGHALAMALCQVQGVFEHRQRGLAVPQGVSHYGRLYNLLWFHDGFHVEHHRSPGKHWTRLPSLRTGAEPASPLPPLLRALDTWVPGGRASGRLLVRLERIALASPALQTWLIARHAQAFRLLLGRLPQPPQRILVVGGGLFPRTVAVLRQVLPDASLTVIEADAAHIQHARDWLQRHDPTARVAFQHARFDARTAPDTDLLVLPLGFVGDLHAARPARTAVLIHVWWRLFPRTGGPAPVPSAPVSRWLLKRVELHLPPSPARREAA